MFNLNETGNSKTKSIIIFFVLTYIISWPFFILAALAVQGILPAELEYMWYTGAAAPLIVALILVYKEKKGAGIKNLFKRGFKYKIPKKIWYIPTLFLLPVIFLIALGIIFLVEGSISNPPLQLWLFLPMLATFFFSALAEELGWRGYAFDPMQDRRKAFGATMILGPIWVIWHLPLFISGVIPPGTTIGVIGLCLALMGIEIFHTWIYINTDKSIFTVILFHTVYNVCTLFLPNYAAGSGPLITGITILIISVVVMVIYGPRDFSKSANKS